MGRGSSARLAGTVRDVLEGMRAREGAWSSWLPGRAAEGDGQASAACGCGVVGMGGCPARTRPPSCLDCPLCCVLRRSPVSLFIMAASVSLQPKPTHLSVYSETSSVA